MGPSREQGSAKVRPFRVLRDGASRLLSMTHVFASTPIVMLRSAEGASRSTRDLGLRLDLAFALLWAVALSLGIATGAAAQPVPRQGYDCLLEPRLKVKVATPVAGVLREVAVDRGQRVRRGEVVARLESSLEEAAAAIASAKAEDDAAVLGKQARLEMLTRKRDRIAELRSKGAATAVQLDEAEADRRISAEDGREAASNLRLARLEAQRSAEVVNQRRIRSPLDGIVTERNLWNGEYGYEQAPIMTVAQLDPLNVEVYLPIALYPTLKPGQAAEVTPDAPFGGRHTATVEVVDTVFDARSGTFGVRLTLPNPTYALPGGLRCTVRFAGEASAGR